MTAKEKPEPKGQKVPWERFMVVTTSGHHYHVVRRGEALVTKLPMVWSDAEGVVLEEGVCSLAVPGQVASITFLRVKKVVYFEQVRYVIEDKVTPGKCEIQECWYGPKENGR
jgi:hypothetical protein